MIVLNGLESAAIHSFSNQLRCSFAIYHSLDNKAQARQDWSHILEKCSSDGQLHIFLSW
jgi:hypothetical protein